MKTITTILLSILPLTSSFSQQVDNPEYLSFQLAHDRLIEKISFLQDSVEFLSKKMDSLLTQQLIQEDDVFVTKTRFTADVYESEILLKKIGTIKSGSRIYVLDYDKGQLLITDKEIRGYISSSDVEQSKLLETYIKIKSEQEQREVAQNKEINAKNYREKRLKMVTDKFGGYGTEIVNNIVDGKYWIGMTDEMALYSIGQPEDINRTVTTYGISEQWVYDNTYLYFENGVLKSYQN